MKTITQLSGSLTETDYREPRGILHSLHLEPQPGVHLKVSLGAAGLVFRRDADTAVAYRIEDLTALVLERCPELIALPAGAAAAAATAAGALSAATRLAKSKTANVKRDPDQS